jgi:hypothetical protein
MRDLLASTAFQIANSEIRQVKINTAAFTPYQTQPQTCFISSGYWS